MEYMGGNKRSQEWKLRGVEWINTTNPKDGITLLWDRYLYRTVYGTRFGTAVILTLICNS